MAYPTNIWTDKSTSGLSLASCVSIIENAHATLPMAYDSAAVFLNDRSELRGRPTPAGDLWKGGSACATRLQQGSFVPKTAIDCATRNCGLQLLVNEQESTKYVELTSH
jgi:hypothetical protein